VNKLAVFVLLIGVAACSSKKPEEGREPAQTPPPGAVVGVPAASAGAAGSGAAGSSGGGAPGAGVASGTSGSPKAPESGATNVGCATATTLVCGSDQADGCAGGLTAVHVCVAKEAKAGPPCAQEPALSCPSGQVDACLHNPPQANNHLCVIVPRSTP
jgi:hypothetical protein